MPPVVVTASNSSIVPDASLVTEFAVTAPPSRVMPAPLSVTDPNLLVPPSAAESRISSPAARVRLRASVVLLLTVLAKLIVPLVPAAVAAMLPVNSTPEANEIPSVVRMSPLSLFAPAPLCVNLVLMISPSADVMNAAALAIIASPVAVIPALSVSALPVNLKYPARAVVPSSLVRPVPAFCS